MMLRRLPPLALLALLAAGLSGCATLGLPDYGYPDGYPDRRYPDDRYPGQGYPGDYHQTTEYRSIGRDAERYTDLLDRELGLNGSQEYSIERVLEGRAERLLRSTHPRDHRYVYPFPRDQRLSDTARRWWDDTDREINRYLDGYQRDEYRYIAGDLERYGRYDGRYDRNRRYDDRYRDDDRYDRDGDRDDRYRSGRGPSFCRSGAGHPVYGRRWCTDRGYYPDPYYDRDYDRRRDDDDDDDD
jgi:hypothetical protein